MKKVILMLAAMMMMVGCGDDRPSEPPKEVPPPAPSKTVDMNGVKDGTYTVDSSADESHGITRLTVTISDGKINAVEFVGIDRLGNVKDENYGADGGDKSTKNYKKAQAALRASEGYAKQLVETQALDKVDAISGATISYNQFVEAINKAVDEAKR